MSIKELIDKLVEKTTTDSFLWEKQKENLYRLALDNGSISIQQYLSNYGEEKYIVKLFDLDSCFVQYMSDEVDADFGSLFRAIEASLNRAIERKISEVFGDI